MYFLLPLMLSKTPKDASSIFSRNEKFENYCLPPVVALEKKWGASAAKVSTVSRAKEF